MFESANPIRLVSAQYMERSPMANIEWVVQPVVARGERTLLYGEYGSFKTWLLLHMGLHIAAGRKWLGEFPVTKPRRVLYVDEEMTEQTTILRVKQLLAGSSLPTDGMEFMLASREGVLFTEQGGRILLDRLHRAEYKPEVVIVDSMRATLVGSENEQMDVIAFYRSLEPLLQAGMTVIIAHHMRKPRQEGPDSVRYRASGSTAIVSGSDSAWALTRTDGRGNIAKMEAIRIRMAQEPPPFMVEFTFNGETGPVVASLGLPPEEASMGGQAALIILGVLEGRVGEPTAVLKAACEAEGIPARTIERAIASLEQQGRIAKVGGQRGVWALTTPQ